MSKNGGVAFYDDEIGLLTKALAHKITARAATVSKSGHPGELFLNINSITLQVIENLCNITINAQALATIGQTREQIQRKEDATREELK